MLTGVTGDVWSAMFRDFQEDAFRLEALPEYRGTFDQELFDAWKRGEEFPAGYFDRWLDTIAAAKASGRTIRRVRVVVQPLTDYVRYECEKFYPFSTAAGEQIRVLDLTDKIMPEIGDIDFWMFDNTTVVHMEYDSTGLQTGRNQLPTNVTAEYIARANTAWEAAVPFSEWAASVRPS